jgi:uncharacterized protein (DUF2249 family)
MPVPKSKILDIRPLLARGEEPFTLIRTEVDRLGAGHSITIIAPFMPAPLIELLKGEGFEVTMERRADGAWNVSFRRP